MHVLLVWYLNSEANALEFLESVEEIESVIQLVATRHSTAMKGVKCFSSKWKKNAFI